MEECPCMDITAWISMWISTLMENEVRHPKIMDIHMDNRGLKEIHLWICYGFLDQGRLERLTLRSLFRSEIYVVQTEQEGWKVTIASS